LILLYLLIHVFGLLVGVVKANDELSEMLTEFQQSLYWLAAPFYALVLQSPAMVYKTSVLVRAAGLFLALAYFVVLAMLGIGRLSILEILPLLHDSGEVLVRGDNFLFYKGFLYLGIGIVFFVAMRGKYWKSCSGLIIVALILTLTRGFVLSVSVAILLMLFAQKRRALAGFALILVAVAAFLVFLYIPSLNHKFSEGRTASNSTRQLDFYAIVDTTTPESLLLGQGYGAAVNDRQAIENSLLWAIWKLGIVGLAFWTLPMGLCTYFYLRIPNRMNHPIAAAFFYSMILVYVQTLTNPYLNNPIGLSFVLVAIFSLRTLAKEARLQQVLDVDGSSLGNRSGDFQKSHIFPA
jgi:hypothetical protein